MPEIRAASDDQVLLAAEEARPGVASRQPQRRWPIAAKVAIIGLLVAGCAFGAAAALVRGKEMAKSSAPRSVQLYGDNAFGDAGYQQRPGNEWHPNPGGGNDQTLPGSAWRPGNGNGWQPQPGFDQMGHGDAYHGSRPQVYPGTYGAQPSYYHYNQYHYSRPSFIAMYFWWIVFFVILVILGCVALYLYLKNKAES